jgi:hypothetical protein
LLHASRTPCWHPRVLASRVELSIIVDDADGCIATCGPFLLVIARRNARADILDALHAAFSLPDLRGVLVIVEAGAALPSPETRRRLVSLYRANPGIRGFAFVLEGEGFKVAAARGVVTGLVSLVRAPYPQKTFAEGAAAVRWLASVCDAPEGAVLFRALGRLRREPAANRHP